jgi:tetrahydromethanopterin S-methyltransferase subunit G
MDIGQWILYGIAVGVTAFSWYAVIRSIRAGSAYRDLGEREDFQGTIYWVVVGMLAVLLSIVLYRSVGVL